MNKLSAILLLLSVSFGAIAAEQYEIKNKQVYVTKNGIKTNKGKVREVETREGKTKIYTTRDYYKPAVTMDRRGNIIEDDEDE